MQRLQFVLVLGVVAVAATASNGRLTLGAYLDGLNKSSSLSVDYTVQALGNPRDMYFVRFQKPNKFRIETPEETIVGDGTTLTRIDRGLNQFMKRPQSPTDLSRFLAPAPLRLWAPFFDARLAKVEALRDLGVKERGTGTYQTVETPLGRGTVTYYIDTNTKLAGQFEYAETGAPSLVMVTRNFSTQPVSAETFTVDTKKTKGEISEAAYDSPRWLTDLVQATALAKRTKKRVFVDFVDPKGAVTQKMETEVYSTDSFKNFSNRLVFVRIDSTKQGNVNSIYGVEKLPTQMILDEEGEEIATNEGYESAVKLIEWMTESLRAN
jgi:outer membrane lipoprotein-sorting protein